MCQGYVGFYVQLLWFLLFSLGTFIIVFSSYGFSFCKQAKCQV